MTGPPDVVVTGLGVVSPAGRGLAAARAALRAGRSGLGPLTRFRSPRCGAFPVAEVRGLAAEPDVPYVVTLARHAAAEALHGAGLGRSVAPERIGLVLGTCVGGMPETEQALRRERAGEPFDPAVLLRHECGYATAALARLAGAEGPTLTVSTACASGAQAIASGAALIASGRADVVLAGGADALCRLTLNGFAALLAIDPAGCRPFDRARRGMSLGEGAAFLVLERAACARDRGGVALARLAGCANTCDAHHATAPDPDGRGAEAALRGALDVAGLAPERIGYVNAHGTGTTENDRAEGRALARVFGPGGVPVSSTKRVFGHGLGAAGAVEAVVAVLALVDGWLPGTPGLADPDPECVVRPLQEGVTARPEHVLTASFGFGGNNAVLAFSRPQAHR